MAQVFFYIGFIPWSGVFMGLLWSTTVLGAAMKNNRIQKEEMWGINRGAFLTDPGDLTEIEKIYRQKAMVVELLLVVWGAIGWIGAAIMSGILK